MKKSAIVLLVFSCLFVTTTIVLLFFTSMFAFSSLDAIFNPKSTGGDVLGGVILFILMIPYCLGSAASALLILPFDIIMIAKMKINRWFTKAILIFAIAAIVYAIMLLFSVPIVSALQPSSSSSSSMISSSN